MQSEKYTSERKSIMSKRKLILTVLAMLCVCALFCTYLTVNAESHDVDICQSNEDNTAVGLSSPIGVRLKMNGSFTSFKFFLATYTGTDRKVTFEIYGWNQDYDTTVSQTPLASEKDMPIADNAYAGLEFDPLPAGEYLIMVKDPVNSVALWSKNTVTEFTGFVYKDGSELSHDLTPTPVVKITFTEELDQYFTQCEASKDPIDGNHTTPPEYEIPSDSLIYTHKVMPDTWVFTDGLGRTSLTYEDVGDPKEDKTLALFYWSWHEGQGHKPPFNNQEFLEKYPEALNDYDFELWPEVGQVAHFWNEPIYGYYKTDDEWVLRRQAELLANAGVDVVFTDNTNGTFTWRTSYLAMYETWTQAMEDGVLTPKISFMLPFSAGEESKTQLKELYLDIFREDKYQNLWFYFDGKPLIMAHSSNLSSTSNVEKEILNFFTFRENYAGYINQNPSPKNWGWLSTYPQAVYYASQRDKLNNNPEQITVGVAVNHNYRTHQITAMNGRYVIGRSYTSTGYHTEENAKLYGYNFTEQFDYALEVNPEVVFVTGWNEWIAGRYETWPDAGAGAVVKNAFPDQCNDEYSRDLEPSKGDLKDHYYYLFVNYVRKYKGCNPIPEPNAAKTIDISGNVEQWNSVEPYYAAYIGNTGDRDNAEGYGTLTYSEYSGRNDIIGAKVARDDDNLYFLVECNEDITPYTDKLWMVLYIDSDQQNQGWESFDYVVNKTSPTETKAYLEKFTGDGYQSELVGEVDYKTSGKYMQIKIPKSMLSLEGYDFTINFSWTDNVHDESDAGVLTDGEYKYSTFSGDILDFYISGDVAPGARFKFSYISTSENAGKTSVESDSTTNETNTTETGTNEGESDISDDKSGCKSSADIPSVLLMAVIACTAVSLHIKRKSKQN